jgi:antitoxin MazE
MEAVIRKWGNSLGIRIPSVIIRQLALKDGAFVDIADNKNAIIIRPVQKRTLAELLQGIDENNIHAEVKTYGPVGSEIW